MFLRYCIVVLSVIFCFDIGAKVENKNLRVLFVVAYFPAPSQTYILNMMTGLIDKGHQVSIFAFRKNNGAIPQPNVEKYGLLDSVLYEEFPKELPDCDIVFCQSATWAKKIIEMEALQQWLKNKKIVVCLRGADIASNVVAENSFMYHELFQKADLFLPVCEYFKRLVIGYGCDSHKVVVLHSAIDCQKFSFRERKRDKKKRAKINLVSVCRLVQKKGVEYAIEAFAEVAKKYKTLRFTIVGTGHLQNKLKRLAARLGVLHRITFFGWGTQDQVAEILDKSHIFLLPSVTSPGGEQEGIANALKEAMSMGLIAIATPHAGTPELVEDGVSGFLVPEGNSMALAKKIKYVIKHPEIWKSMGIAARKKVENEFEIKKTMDQLEDLFFQLF